MTTPKVAFRFEVDGEVQLSRAFDMAGQTLEDWAPVFAAWGEDFRETQYNVFWNEGAFEGRSRWAELSPRYRAWKDLHYPGRNILVLTGAMMSGLTDPNDPDHVYEIDEDQMTIGVRSPYAQYHQHGTSKMPQRKVVELTQPQKRRWTQIVRTVMWEQLQATLEDSRRGYISETGVERQLASQLEREPG